MSEPTDVATFDFCVPEGFEPPHHKSRGRWSPSRLRTLLEHLDKQGGQSIRELSLQRLLNAWSQMLGELINPGSELRRKLSPTLATSYDLSEPGLRAALEIIVEGAGGDHAQILAERASQFPKSECRQPAAIVILPSKSNDFDSMQ